MYIIMAFIAWFSSLSWKEPFTLNDSVEFSHASCRLNYRLAVVWWWGRQGASFLRHFDWFNSYNGIYCRQSWIDHVKSSKAIVHAWVYH